MVSFRLIILTLVLAFFNVLVFSVQAVAESVSVSPTNLSVPSGAQQAVLTVKAIGASQSIVQIRVFRWNSSRPPSELFDQTSVV